jgi:hypothetical protein
VKKTAILIAALAGTLLAFQAQAQSPGQGYFGVGYGAVWTDGASPYSDTIDEDTAGGAKIYGGSMWNNFGLEVGLYSLGKYNVNVASGKVADTSTMAVAVSGVMATPLGGGYSFHGKVGLAFTQSEINCVALCGTGFPALASTTKRGTSGLLGLGIGAKLWQDVMVRIDYEHFGNVHHQIGTFKYNDSDDILSVNLQLNF